MRFYVQTLFLVLFCSFFVSVVWRGIKDCDNSDFVETSPQSGIDGLSSLHRCVGGGSSGLDTFGFITATDKDSHRLRSCEFINLCYERSSESFVYFTSKETSRRTSFSSSKGSFCSPASKFAKPLDILPDYGFDAMFAVPLDRLSSKPLVGVLPSAVTLERTSDTNSGYHRTKDRSTALKLKQVIGDIPSAAKWLKGDFLALKRYAAANWGHTLVQAVLPSFILMHYFGEKGEWLRKDLNFVFLDDCFDESDIMIAFPADLKYRKMCHRNSEGLFGLLSGKRAKSIKELLVGVEEDLICFPRLFAGTEAFSYLNGPVYNDGGRAAFMNMFREFVLEKNNLLQQQRSDNTFRIVFARKGKTSFNSRGIENAEDIVNFLRTEMKEIQGVAVEVKVLSVEDTTTKEQAVEVSKSDVLIAPGGATSMASIFLSPDATMIMTPFCAKGPCIFSDASKCACSEGFCCYQLEDYFYFYLRANVLVVPVELPTDLSGSCDCFGGYCKDCNIHVRTTELKTLIYRAFEYKRQHNKMTS